MKVSRCIEHFFNYQRLNVKKNTFKNYEVISSASRFMSNQMERGQMRIARSDLSFHNSVYSTHPIYLTRQTTIAHLAIL
jgi:hypothetical protein